ncbi:DEAD/DEAH box helicase [Pseudofrankia sp. BMG5.36]|uniref:DEAD/DEAH box helicase n=1 Tax=Pseudofrankia sp. BMG5.36 TaxID=1834512 RepID=UPI0008D9209F|nr:DEAD/DEAH box helicase [Pseudofrankia sp. BMG5.36]OHV62897.1 hypothetical protein BCD48_38845 [Pseudofrankia sp. BMG5.36]
MRPTVAAERLRRTLTQYLTTTFALADEGEQAALAAFLDNPEYGIYRGPYLRVRTPFRPAPDGWREHLDWAPADWAPYAHQAAAFERLSTKFGPAKPTVLTTGTGSGKTEAFLLPILDHCRHASAAGQPGVKALLLYPMNALATDQTGRLNALLADPALASVTGGLYIGDAPAQTYPRVMTDRAQIRRTPPDILITNYKMLDQLLQRPEDVPLWQANSLAYVVLDEFHTYDGAQGTDVAMLLRRLGAVTGAARPGRPLGLVCPVATSATLGSGAPADDTVAAIRAVAEEIFGAPFDEDAVIGEDRLAPDEILDDPDPRLPDPDPASLAAIPLDGPALSDQVLDGQAPSAPAGAAEERARHLDAMRPLAVAVLGPDAAKDLTPASLGVLLRRHKLTRAVLRLLGDTPRTADEALEGFPREDLRAWGVALATQPELAAAGLARFVALLSVARDPADPRRPLVMVETHLWVRAVSRLLRAVAHEPAFGWDGEQRPAPSPPLDLATTAAMDDGAAPAVAPRAAGGATAGAAGGTGTATGVVADSGQPLLPAVYCRHCGRSGWAALSPERGPTELVTDPTKIYRAGVGREKRRVRALIRATDQEARSPAGSPVMMLDASGTRLHTFDPASNRHLAEGYAAAAGGTVPAAGVPVLCALDDSAGAEADRCPACGLEQGIRYLGAGLASLASVSVSQLFTGGELPDRASQRTLLFNDSVQDAAHRAGFVAARAFTFSLRALLAAQLADGVPVALNDLIADLVAAGTDRETLAAIVPPELHDVQAVDDLLSGRGRPRRDTWRLLGDRLGFATVLEFGLRSRNGRTLELTRTVAAEAGLPATARPLARDTLVTANVQTLFDDLDDARLDAYLRGLLERLRIRGAVGHRWLDVYLTEGGRRFRIWGGRPDGMPAFPRGLAAPAFLLTAPRPRTQFDVLTGAGNWYQDWTVRCLGLSRDHASDYLRELLPRLADTGALARRVIVRPLGNGRAPGRGRARSATPAGGITVYGLQPGHITVTRLGDADARDAGVRCDACAWTQTVPPARVADWVGQPCHRYRCPGRLRPAPLPRAADDYYRRLYQDGGTFRVVTAEHTGLLTREQRETVEHAFRDGTHYTDPNVLSCTPTLELGIDIGALSTVLLASLPGGPANYVQRAGRAGRRSGNAFVLTLLERGEREQYYLTEPRDMIAGEIAPPGTYLSAIEILRRQYVAHLVDLTARGRLPDTAPLPRLAGNLFGADGWLTAFTDAALKSGAAEVERFLALFGPAGEDGGTLHGGSAARGDGSTALREDGADLWEGTSGEGSQISASAAAELRQYAVAGLADAAAAAERAWEERLAGLRHRIDAIDQARAALLQSDEEQRRDFRALSAQRRAVARLAGDITGKAAHATLVELGLLPNYALFDGATTLEATLTWDELAANGERRFVSDVREYARPTRQALTEIAPGNTYYVRGYAHRVTGLDIGPRGRPTWEFWRICPTCGYVRTPRTAPVAAPSGNPVAPAGDPSVPAVPLVDDAGPCERCRGTGIGDAGARFAVLRPTRVTAADRRDDARIRDDLDDREGRSYTTATTVDVDPVNIARSWRHTHATFGVDYARPAVVRAFNLGTTRPDRTPTDTFAGEEVSLTLFHVCVDCGGTAVDGPPPTTTGGTGFGQPELADGPGTMNGERSESGDGLRGHEHHRLWCRHRRHPQSARHQPLLLAAELRTEAVRILVPALTTSITTRRASFAAALRLGIARQYRGSPDHLRLVSAVMPDAATGTSRQFLVLYDSQPGGTGYLHRLADPENFRAVLAAALEAIETCACVDAGRPGCPRCLLRYARGDEFAQIQRAEAVGILRELLDDWDVADSGPADQMSMVSLVESELEARFLDGLRAWGARPGSPGTLTAGAAVTGAARVAELRISGPGGAITHWRMRLQHTIAGTRPDVHFARLDGPPMEVAVYLDGFRYHATAEHNRLADDADKRSRLRAHGVRVFQFTWDDVEEWRTRSAGAAPPPRPPYQGLAQEQAHVYYRTVTAPPRPADELDRHVWINPVDLLLAFLADPDGDLWRVRAEATLGGLLRTPGMRRAQTGTAGLAAVVDASLRGGPLPAGSGAIHVIGARDDAGCPVTVVIDDRGGVQNRVFSALVLVDDRDEAVGEAIAAGGGGAGWAGGDGVANGLDTPTDGASPHRRRWASWLAWTNLTQFLADGDGDAVQLTVTGIDDFDPALLAAAGGGGLAEVSAAQALDLETSTWLGRPALPAPRPLRPLPPAGGSASEIDLRWREALHLADPVEPGLLDLMHALIALALAEALPAPEVGFELGDGGWMAELAWPDARVGVALAPVGPADQEAADRDEAYRNAGWDVRTTAGWTAAELADRVRGGTPPIGRRTPTEGGAAGAAGAGFEDFRKGAR